MKTSSVDLGSLWEGVAYRFEQRGVKLPLRWLAFYKFVKWVLTHEVLG